MFELGVPVLGICYGMQTMAQQLGGRVQLRAQREFGYAQVDRVAAMQAVRRICAIASDAQGRACSMCG